MGGTASLWPLTVATRNDRSARGGRRPRVVGDAWFRLRIILGSTRAGHAALARTPRADRGQWVGAGARVCIEGFPRSGNTFVTRTFREWNPEVPVAHHTHLPGQLSAAARRGLPAALLVRRPLDAVASLLVFAEGGLSPRAAVRAYVDFHRPLIPILESLVVCPFERVVDDSAYVVRSLNGRFGTDFHALTLEGHEREELLARIARMQRRRGHADLTSTSVPNELRAKRQRLARERVAAERELAKADELYGALSSRAPA